jgi:hypothetical protein
VQRHPKYKTEVLNTCRHTNIHSQQRCVLLLMVWTVSLGEALADFCKISG